LKSNLVVWTTIFIHFPARNLCLLTGQREKVKPLFYKSTLSVLVDPLFVEMKLIDFYILHVLNQHFFTPASCWWIPIHPWVKPVAPGNASSSNASVRQPSAGRAFVWVARRAGRATCNLGASTLW
jgi:hypothetical protein